MAGSATAVIAAYNGRRYLEECLTSVLGEIGAGDEVIVVDNASTDGTAAFVREQFPCVRLVQNGENRGFAAACNQGAALARGEVLVFLNQDTRVEPGWLRGLVQALEAGGNTGLVTSQVRLMSQPERIHLCGQDVHFAGLVFARGFGQVAEAWSACAEVAAVSGASFAVRRDVWQALGGLDEAFFMYYEETDLCWRARLRGHRSRYVPGSVVYHDYRPGASDARRFYYTCRNRQQMLLKSWRAGTLLLLAPGLLLAEMVEWGLSLRMGWPGVRAKARALGWVLGHLGAIRRGRAAAQAGRIVTDAEVLEERVHRIDPRESAAGPLGKALVAACNGLFCVNLRVARAVCRVAAL